VSRSQAEVAAALNAIPSRVGVTFRGNRGDNTALVTRDLVYT
jgi:hypothetical protein